MSFYPHLFSEHHNTKLDLSYLCHRIRIQYVALAERCMLRGPIQLVVIQGAAPQFFVCDTQDGTERLVGHGNHQVRCRVRRSKIVYHVRPMRDVV